MEEADGSASGGAVSYFVVKSYSKQGLEKSRRSGEWACSDRLSGSQPRQVLAEAYRKGDVCLVFSVNNCHGWHGYASMTSLPADQPCLLEQSTDESANGQVNTHDLSDKQWYKFTVTWEKLLLDLHKEKCLHFDSTQNLLCADRTTPLNKARNYQELDLATGHTICHMIDEQYDRLLKENEDKKREREARIPPPFLQVRAMDTSHNASVDGSLQSHSQVWEKVVAQVSGMGRVLVACAFGSQRYNCHTAGSDLDMFVVYRASTAAILGFTPPQQTIKNREGEDFDYTILELQRFCELLLAGDPRCVECLFLHPSSVFTQSEEWRQLVQFKQCFLTKQVHEKYMHDALGAKGTRLLDKWVKSGAALHTPMEQKVGKLFYIILRLLQNARDVIEFNSLRVYREDGSEEKQLLMAARACSLPYQQLRATVDRMTEELKERAESHSFERTDSSEARTLLEPWLIKLRYHNLHEHIVNL